MQGPFFPGYILYLAGIFVPGIGLGELLLAWEKRDGLATKVAMAFGLGLAFDTLVLLVRTSGLKIGEFVLLGIDPTTIYLIIASGLLALVIGLLRKRRFDFPVRPSRVDLVLFALMMVQGVIMLLWFEKYPIFPGFQSPDYGTHVQIAQGLVAGTTASLPGGILYYGVHYQLASALVLVGGEGLVTAQRVMAMLVLFSPFLLFTAAKKVFSSVKAGVLTTAIYSLTGTFWFNSVFTSGLYPNFFGLLAVFFFLVAYLMLAEKIRSKGAWVVFGLAVVTLYFSHYSSITIFPILLFLPLVKLAGKKTDARSYLVPSIVALAPAVVGFAFFPGAASTLLEGLFSATGIVFGGTALSGALSAIPVLSDMALEVSDDVAFVVLLVLAAICIYKTRASPKALYLTPLVWFAALIVASFASSVPERFSLEALVPLTMMAGSGFSSILPQADTSRRKTRRRGSGLGRRVKFLIVIIVFLTPIVVNSWGQWAVTYATTETGDSAHAQQEVYNAMYWLRDNTPINSTYLSVSDWRFTYSSLFFGRTTVFYYTSNPVEALSVATQKGAQYIIVTYFVTLQLPAGSNFYPWNTIQQSANLSLVYSTDDVRIFKVLA